MKKNHGVIVVTVPMKKTQAPPQAKARPFVRLQTKTSDLRKGNSMATMISVIKSMYRAFLPASVRTSPMVTKLKAHLLGHDWIYNSQYYESMSKVRRSAAREESPTQSSTTSRPRALSTSVAGRARCSKRYAIGAEKCVDLSIPRRRSNTVGHGALMWQSLIWRVMSLMTTVFLT